MDFWRTFGGSVEHERRAAAPVGGEPGRVPAETVGGAPKIPNHLGVAVAGPTEGLDALFG